MFRHTTHDMDFVVVTITISNVIKGSNILGNGLRLLSCYGRIGKY
jgi:hypothetical protein